MSPPGGSPPPPSDATVNSLYNTSVIVLIGLYESYTVWSWTRMFDYVHCSVRFVSCYWHTADWMGISLRDWWKLDIFASVSPSVAKKTYLSLHLIANKTLELAYENAPECTILKWKDQKFSWEGGTAPSQHLGGKGVEGTPLPKLLPLGTFCARSPPLLKSACVAVTFTPTPPELTIITHRTDLFYWIYKRYRWHC